MYKMIEALESGRVLQFKHEKVKYYKMVDGRIYSSYQNDEQAEWQKTRVKRSAFHNENKWIVL